jgi:hypothetical protein
MLDEIYGLMQSQLLGAISGIRVTRRGIGSSYVLENRRTHSRCARRRRRRLRVDEVYQADSMYE